LRLRDEKIVAKGKGELVTYWLEVKSLTSGSKSSCSSGNDDDISKNSATTNECNLPSPHLQRSQKTKKLLIDKIDRLIDWNTDSLLRFLHQILIGRQEINEDDVAVDLSIKTNPFDEVKEIIVLPQVTKSKNVANESLIRVPNEASIQLRDYVSKIAYMYNDNHFHNFEHVSL
jgi:hypothetical protein